VKASAPAPAPAPAFVSKNLEGEILQEMEIRTPTDAYSADYVAPSTNSQLELGTESSMLTSSAAPVDFVVQDRTFQAPSTAPQSNDPSLWRQSMTAPASGSVQPYDSVLLAAPVA
jgi:hypothetical protein